MRNLLNLAIALAGVAVGFAAGGLTLWSLPEVPWAAGAVGVMVATHVTEPLENGVDRLLARRRARTGVAE